MIDAKQSKTFNELDRDLKLFSLYNGCIVHTSVFGDVDILSIVVGGKIYAITTQWDELKIERLE